MRENILLCKIKKKSIGAKGGTAISAWRRARSTRAPRRIGEKSLERKFTPRDVSAVDNRRAMQFTYALFREKRYGVQVTGYVIELVSPSPHLVRRFRFSHGRNFDSAVAGPGCKNDIHAPWDSPWRFPRWHACGPNRRNIRGSESSLHVARRDIDFAR